MDLTNVNFDELIIYDNYDISINNFDPNCPLRKILGNVEIDILNLFLQKDNENLLKVILDNFKSNIYLYDEEKKVLTIKTNLNNLIK